MGSSSVWAFRPATLILTIRDLLRLRIRNSQGTSAAFRVRSKVTNYSAITLEYSTWQNIVRSIDHNDRNSEK